jgi:hypothetical protein
MAGYPGNQTLRYGERKAYAHTRAAEAPLARRPGVRGGGRRVRQSDAVLAVLTESDSTTTSRLRRATARFESHDGHLLRFEDLGA